MAKAIDRAKAPKRHVVARPTIVDVARAADVSVATASNAVNNHPSVKAATKAHVSAVALRLGYRTNVYARRLRAPGMSTIALVSTFPYPTSSGPARDGYLMDVAGIAAVTAIRNRMGLLLVPPSVSQESAIGSLAIDGALIVEPTADDPNIAHIREQGVPFVTIGRPDFPAACIDLRVADAARLVLNHFREGSCKRIALLVDIVNRPTQSAIERTYLAFCTRHRMQPAVVRIDHHQQGESTVVDAVAALIANHPDVDALFVPFDALATAVVRALHGLRIDIGTSMKIATRYDSSRARESSPPMTAVDLHLDVVVDLAVGQLLSEMSTGISETILLGPRPTLIVRASSQR